MASKFYKFYGECQWAKVYEPDKKYERYSIDVFLDDASWNLFRRSGLQLKVRDYEGREFVSFARPVKKLIKNDLVEFGPPKVTDSVGRVIEDLVGNGSKVSVTVAVYDTVKGKGHRLEAVQVDQLVEYEGNKVEDAHDDQSDEVIEPEKKPEPKKRTGKIEPGLNDPLPF